MNWFHHLILLFILLFSPVAYADETGVTQALRSLETINGFPAEDELTAIIPEFYRLPAHPESKEVQKLFEEKGLTQWSAKLADYLGLCDILFESLELADQAAVRAEYTRSRAVLAAFKDDITAYVLAIHPGFSILGITPLQEKWNGRGVRIVVFDVFEPALLTEQKLRFPRATIEATQRFGRPVELSHGNTVIDIILQLAPEALIIPISSDAKSYASAMAAIAARDDIDIVNMSRAFPEDPVTKTIDAEFQKALRILTRKSILIKALGNNGSDLFGNLNQRRTELGLGPVNSLTSYDLKLIRDLYQTSDTPGMEVFALNLALFADDIALTATVPGNFEPVQERTLAVPADGIHSPSTGTFESGSSFAAPQVSAWTALLIQKQRTLHPEGTDSNARKSVYGELLQNTDNKGHLPSEWGRGLPKP